MRTEYRGLGHVTDLAVAGETLTLLAERAVWWAGADTLFVADTHFGKTAAFRASGIPIPAGTTADDLARLSTLIEGTGAKRLVVLGDLIHAKAGRDERPTVEAVAAWRDRHDAVECVLVRGNHDARAGDPEPCWRFECVDPGVTEGPFEFRHFPVPRGEAAAGFVLAGHLHPMVRVTGDAGDRHRLPVFLSDERQLTLPAFGGFVDGTRVTPREDQRVDVAVDGAVVTLHLPGRVA
ncbi:MAG: ligase-associated DNA damage response endonuclease PdeM [Planctomycetota bacterium]